MTGRDIEQVADLEQVCFSESWSENLIRIGSGQQAGYVFCLC